MTTDEAIAAVTGVGYRVSVHRMSGALHLSGGPLPVPDVYVEMHAIHDGGDGDGGDGGDGGDEVYIARVEGAGDDVERQCAVELLRLVTRDAS